MTDNAEMSSFPFLFFICRHTEEKKGLTFAAFSEQETKAFQKVGSPPQLLSRQAPGALGMKVCKKKCVNGNDLAQKWKEVCPFLSKKESLWAPSASSVSESSPQRRRGDP